MAFAIHEDKMHLEILPENLRDFLKRNGLVKAYDIERVDFCGLVFVDGNISVFLPRNASSPEMDARSISSLLMSSIKRYADSYSSSSLGVNENNDDQNNFGFEFLSDALWLLRDYAENGLYRVKEKAKKINDGKFDWKKTIAKMVPIQADIGFPVYLMHYGQRTKYSTDNFITAIHAEVIRLVTSLLGWCFVEENSDSLYAELSNIAPSGLSLEKQSYLIQRELVSIYSDRDTRLLRTVLKIINQQHDLNLGDVIVGVKNFQNVWEEMLRQTLPNVISVNAVLPKPAYFLSNGKVDHVSRGMATDIVMKNGDMVAVVDAKYYDARSASTVPGWGDIVKQLFYEKAVNFVFSNAKISNWFAFPGNTKSLLGKYAWVRMVDPNTNDDLSSLFAPIRCGYFSVTAVMSCYQNHKKLSDGEIDILALLPPASDQGFI